MQSTIDNTGNNLTCAVYPDDILIYLQAGMRRWWYSRKIYIQYIHISTRGLYDYGYDDSPWHNCLRSAIASGHRRHGPFLHVRLGLAASKTGIFSRSAHRSLSRPSARQGVSCPSCRVTTILHPLRRQRDQHGVVANTGSKRHFGVNTVITTTARRAQDEKQRVAVGIRSCDECIWQVGGVEAGVGLASARDD